MRQRKYILYSVLGLLLIIGIYLLAKQILNRSTIRKDAIPVNFQEVSNQDSSVIAGKKLFMKNCTSCHTIFKDLTGPALAGVETRWKNKGELMAYIRNPAAASKKNPYIIALRKRYVSAMTLFPDLTDKEVQSILDYIAFEEKRKGIPVAVPSE